MEDKKLNLDLSVNEINTILHSLSKEPYNQVFNLITKIKSQADLQISNLEKPTE